MAQYGGLRFALEGHRPSEELVTRTWRNRFIAEYYGFTQSFGDPSFLVQLVEKLPNSQVKRLLQGVHREIRQLSQKQLSEIATGVATHGWLLTLALLLGGACDEECTICCTDRKRAPFELSWAEHKQLLDQARNAGARIIYTAGLGEPTLDPSFMRICEYARMYEMTFLFFTNGVVFCDDDVANARFQMSSCELTRLLSRYPINMYFTLWSTDPAVLETMGRRRMAACLRRNAHKINYPGGAISIPAGLHMLLQEMPPGKLGVELTVTKHNQENVLRELLPFLRWARQDPRIGGLGLGVYLEPLVHLGRNLGDFSHDPEERVLSEIEADDWVRSPRWCSEAKNPTKLTVDNRGFLQPGLAITPEQAVAYYFQFVQRRQYSSGDQDSLLDRLNVRTAPKTYGAPLKELFSLRFLDPDILRLFAAVTYQPTYVCVCDLIPNKLSPATPATS